MKSKSVKGGWILRFEKGEELVSSLTEFLDKKSIKGAWLSGLGAFIEAEVGYFDLEKSEYEFFQIEEMMEITNLMGNVAQINGNVALHIHVTLAKADLSAIGGHLKSGIVGGTCEIFLQELDEVIRRKEDKNTGLNLMDL